jgi:4-deoxy-L-threo-5-hexosulose-uronate ketol-isomerase
LKILHSVHPEDFKTYQTTQIRERFLLNNLVQGGQVNFVYTHYDRLLVGAVNPVNQAIALGNYANLRAGFFLERREMGIINVAGDGEILADGHSYPLKKLDCLYLGKGVKSVSFISNTHAQPAVFYILSAPAHTHYPNTLLTLSESAKVETGDPSTANRRTICKYIHADGIKSCQLVMGLTLLHEGSVWNTMPAHTHDRRTEAYFYFDLPAGQQVIHLMGQGNETRHIMVNNYEAIVSPPWSIHCGSGTASYGFIWGMAGENMDYTDMDIIGIPDLK